MRGAATLLALATLGCASSVTDNPPGAKISAIHVTPNPQPDVVRVDTQVQMRATALDASGAELPTTSFQWRTAGDTHLTIDQNGLASTGDKIGDAWVYAAAGGVEGAYLISIAPPASFYDINPDSSHLLPGQQRRLVVDVGGAPTSTVISGGWSSSDSTIAKVDTSGLVTALAPGRVTISGTYKSVPLRASVFVASVAVPLRFTHVAAGTYNVCALAVDGTAYCWGSRATPQASFGVPDAQPLANILGTSAPLDRCFIYENFGSRPPDYVTQYGLFITSCAMEPVQVETSARFVSIDVQDQTPCGVTADGAAICWGRTGNLGAGNQGSVAPERVGGTLAFANFSFPCGVTLTHDAWCGGAAATRGSADTAATLSQVVGAGDWVTVSGGALDHRCGLTTQGTIMCWGSNSSGQLGTGDSTSSTVPVPIRSDQQFTAVSVTPYGACGLTTSSVIYCWGTTGVGLPGNPVAAPFGGAVRFAALSPRSRCGVATDGAASCVSPTGAGAVASGGLLFNVFAPSSAFGQCGIARDQLLYCWSAASGSGYGAPMTGSGDLRFYQNPQKVVGQ